MAMWRGTVLVLTDISAVVTVGSCERKANVANRLEYRSMNRFCGPSVKRLTGCGLTQTPLFIGVGVGLACLSRSVVGAFGLLEC